MPIINISKNEEIYYQLIDGNKSKPYLIFLHEGLGCIDMWKGFPESLCQQSGCRGLVYDRVGYGKSSAINTPRSIHYLHEYALNELPRIVENVIPNSPFILIGHSDGASIGLIYGAEQSEFLLGIISLAAHVMVENETCEGITLANEAWQANKLNGLYKYHGEKTAQTFNAWAGTWLQPWFKYWNIEYLLPSINVPILALQGSNDQYATHDQLDSIEKFPIGKVYTHLIKDSAHSPHLDATEETTSLMLSFINSIIQKMSGSNSKLSASIKVEDENIQQNRESRFMSKTEFKSMVCDRAAEEVNFSDYIPGCLSTLCAIQSEYYARKWGFSHPYESVISAGVSEFLTRYDENKDFIRLVLQNNRVVGGIAIDHRQSETAQLRWFIVPEHLHGTGIGKKIFFEAMAFVREHKIAQVYLTTFQGLDSARHLYESVGFMLTQKKIATTWGKEVTEQRFDWYADNQSI